MSRRAEPSRLLIAGGSHSDIPLILAARELGFHVTTSGSRAEDLGHQHADATVLCDYSDRQALLQVARAIRADAICACCNDFSALSSAWVAEQLGLPGHDTPETSLIIHHKDQWREFAMRHDVPSPRAITCRSPQEATAAAGTIGFPLMVKPVDLTGGKGICRVDSADALETAVARAFAVSKADRIVLEAFITGSRHGFSCFLRGGRVVFQFADDEIYHLSPYLVSAARAPGACSPESLRELTRQAERIAALLGLVDGIFHVQFIEQAPGQPVIIEICRRAPGDLYIELVRHATGAAYAQWIVRASTGLDLDGIGQRPTSRFITRHCLMADRAGVFEGFDFDPAIEAKIIDRMIWGRPGDPVRDPLTHKFGIVFVDHGSQPDMHAESDSLQQRLAAVINPMAHHD